MDDKLLQEQLDFLQGAFREVLGAAQQIHFDGKHLPHLMALSLHGTIVEQTAACLSLIGSGNFSAVPILMRPMTEAAADLINVIGDPNYVKNMRATDLAQWRKMLAEAGQGGNELLQGLAKEFEIPLELGQLDAELKQLREQKRPDLNVYERFKRAGMTDEYRSVYALFCLDSHGNQSALVSRHLDRDGERMKVSFFKTPTANSVRAQVDSITALLLNSAALTHRELKSGWTGIQALMANHGKLREKLVTPRAQ